MKPKDFKRWRKNLGLSQKTAAEALGLKRRVVQYYEKGERDGKDVGIPKAVRLACYALAEGVSDYHGPRESEKTDLPPRMSNGAAADTAHGAELAAGAVNGDAPVSGKKPGKREKDKSKDKPREKSKGKKDRGKGESALAHEEH